MHHQNHTLNLFCADTLQKLKDLHLHACALAHSLSLSKKSNPQTVEERGGEQKKKKKDATTSCPFSLHIVSWNIC